MSRNRWIIGIVTILAVAAVGTGVAITSTAGGDAPAEIKKAEPMSVKNTEKDNSEKKINDANKDKVDPTGKDTDTDVEDKKEAKKEDKKTSDKKVEEKKVTITEKDDGTKVSVAQSETKTPTATVKVEKKKEVQPTPPTKKTETATKTESKTPSKPSAESKPKPKPQAKPENKPKPQPKPEVKPKPENKPKPKPENKPKPKPTPTYKSASEAKSILSGALTQGGNTFYYDDTVGNVITVTVGSKHVSKILYDPRSYQSAKSYDLESAIEDSGEVQGKLEYKGTQKRMREIEAAVRAAANSVYGSGTSQANQLYRQIIGSKDHFSKSF